MVGGGNCAPESACEGSLVASSSSRFVALMASGHRKVRRGGQTPDELLALPRMGMVRASMSSLSATRLACGKMGGDEVCGWVLYGCGWECGMDRSEKRGDGQEDGSEVEVERTGNR